MKKRDWIYYQTLGNIGNFIRGSEGLKLMGEVQFNIDYEIIRQIDAIVKKMRKIQHSINGTEEATDKLAQTILPLIESIHYEPARILLLCHYLSIRNYFELNFDGKLWNKTLAVTSNLEDDKLQTQIKTIMLEKILFEWQKIWFWSTDFSTVDHDEEE